MALHAAFLAIGLAAVAVNANARLSRPATDSVGRGMRPLEDASIHRASKERVWTDATGTRRTRATLVAVRNDVAKFRRPDGRTAQTPIQRLSQADRRYVRAWQAARERPTLASFGKILVHALGKVSTDPLGARRAFPANATLKDDAPPQKPPPKNAVYVRVSQKFLERQLAPRVARKVPVAESILGSDTFGTAHLVGQPTLRLLPCAEAGLAELRFTGHVHSRTVGYNGPVRIHSHSDTAFAAATRLTLTAAHLSAAPVRTRTRTRSTIDDIATTLPRLRGRIAVAIAWRRAGNQLPLAEQIAARRAATRISREFDQLVAQRVASISASTVAQVAAAQRGLSGTVQELKVSTSQDYLQIVAIAAGSTTWAAAPPRITERPDVEVHVHRTALGGVFAKLNPDGAETLADGMRQWAVQLAAPRITNVAFGMLGEPAPIQARWTDDAEWLTLAWNAPKNRPQDARRQVQLTDAVVPHPAPQRTLAPRVATLPRSGPR